MQEIGTCVVFEAVSGQPAAKCCQCSWEGVAIYDYDLARQVAEHSRSHFYLEMPRPEDQGQHPRVQG